MERKIANQIVPAGTPTSIIVPPDADKDSKYRLNKFAAWLASSGTAWYAVDLAVYRNHLLATGYAPSTVSAHLSTVRARYAAILRDRNRFYGLVAKQTDDVLERKAFVDEIIARLQNAIDPQAAPVKVKTSQDVADAAHLRLTSAQASALMAAPGVRTLKGLRDTAVMATMLCTGIREAEASALEVPDLRQRLGGELALHVREGKGCKERLVPYGELQWVLAVLDKWLEAGGIGQGPVFRGFYKGCRKLRPGRLSVRGIQYILESYPIMVDGRLVTVNPHDLRRTYARRLYEAGLDLVAIQQNLGHADPKTTLGYIGTLDAETRKPPAVYEFDLNGLAGVPVQAWLEA
jgi:site-specific recombinase XerD